MCKLLKIEIKPPPPSLNKMLRRAMQPWAQKKIQQRIGAEVYWQIMEQRAGVGKSMPKPDKNSPRVTIATHLKRAGTRPWDEDNLVAARKWVVDALVKHGVLYDDAPKFVKYTEPTQEFGGGRGNRHFVGSLTLTIE